MDASALPIFVKARSAAALADMSVRKFRYLVSDGKLPAPVKIEGLVRWDREVLIDALRGLAAPAGAEALV